MGKIRRLVLGALGVGVMIPPMLVTLAPGAGAATFKGLTLQNGWTGAPFSTRQPGVSLVSGIVTFKGAISTAGTNPVAFTLPTAYRPATDVYVPVDTCGATNGRLHITPAGVADVETEGAFSNAQCFTSLDGVSYAPSATGFTALTLQNGWTNAPFSTSNAAAEVVAGVVHLKGAIATSGTNAVPFTLPAGFRPATDVYVPLDLCNSANGRLHIIPSGVAAVETAGSFSNAQCFTSLDGASFASSTAGLTSLTLQNGWTNAPFSTSNAAAEDIGGIVHLKGAIATTATNPVAFTLPAQFRPSTDTYVKVDLCGANNGRLLVQKDGTVTVQAEGSNFANAQCFTSLDGASFADLTFGGLALQNSWTNAPFGTRPSAVASSSGIVTLKGAMATTGTNAQAFTLSSSMRPSTNVFVPVDLCGATNGRLVISPSGAVTVQAEGGTFSNAQCFTSLDGVSFAVKNSGFTALTLQNGWTNAPFGTSNAAVKKINGIVSFKGAIATTGTNAVPFTLPAGFRPATDVYVKVDLCSATNGRLHITPAGVVDVEAGTFSNAQCFTSLDGASFALSASGSTALALQNGWTNAPFSTSAAAAKDNLGVVHLKGAIATGGTNMQPFTLPDALRPAANVYVPVDLCGATNGRLLIQSTGVVTVQAEGGNNSNAACFTSLDGAEFAS
jgi:hypothetical protein